MKNHGISLCGGDLLIRGALLFSSTIDTLCTFVPSILDHYKRSLSHNAFSTHTQLILHTVCCRIWDRSITSRKCMRGCSTQPNDKMSKRSRSTSRSPSLNRDSPSETPLSPGTATPERTKLAHRAPSPVAGVMQCALPPHRETLSFTSHEDYEVHYQQAHVNRCSQCSKNFPTGHFLNLHIEENHDPLAEARRARGEKTVSLPFYSDCFLLK